ncbi:MAG TPA: head-tail connector protein [Stellaceae bacterium]|nr:head-tail connector protein [Stellaceae bacterium]
MAYGDLCSLADVKAWLSTGGPGSPFPSLDDALLARLITAESQAIASWFGRPIQSADWIEVKDGLSGPFGPRESRFPFGVIPVSAVSLVIVAGVTIPPIPTPPVAPPGQSVVSFYPTQAGYVFSPTQLTIRGYDVPRKAQCVTLQYTAGYAAVPPDVAQACIELVALRYRERGRIGEISKHLGDGSTVSYERKDIPDSIKTMLQPYRLVAPLYGTPPQPAPTATDPAVLVGAFA